MEFPHEHELEGFWEMYRGVSHEEFVLHWERFLDELRKPRWDESEIWEICGRVMERRGDAVISERPSPQTMYSLTHDEFLKLMAAARAGYRG